MNKVEITFTGAVLDLCIELEGKDIRLQFDGNSKWTRTIEHFEIEGKLDLVLLCKGLNGTTWKLDIRVDGKGPKNYSGIIKKGYSSLSDEIQIPIT